MAANKPEGSNSSYESNVLVYIILFIVMIMTFVIIYQKNKFLIHAVLGYLIQGQLLIFAPFFEIPAKILAWFDREIPGEHPISTIFLLAKVAGSYFRWISIPICLFLMWKILRSSIIERYCVRMTGEKLIQHNASFVPCLRPILHYDILKEHPDKGDWRIARQAVQFAVDNSLLLLPDGSCADSERQLGKRGLVLDKSGLPWLKSPCLIKTDGTFNQEFALSFEQVKALSLFESQLGEKYSGITSLKSHELGLASAFMAFGSGDKAAGQSLLDQISTSFYPSENGYKIDVDGAGELFAKYIDRDDILEILERHGEYVNPFLMALFMLAKQKGVLAPSQFIWLRPYDRTLWYALNQMGGKAAWVEAAGSWAHYQFEETLGESVADKQCHEAVKALRYVLEMEGWLPSSVISNKSGSVQAAVIIKSRSQLQKGVR